MKFSPEDQTILSDMEKARRSYPDLDELLAFYEKLFLAQFAFKSRLRSSGKVESLATKEIRPERLAEGLRQITFDELAVPTAPFLDLYRNVIQLLIPYVSASEGPEPEPDPEKIVEWAREIFHGRDPLIASGNAGDLARKATGLVLAPYLQLACELTLPRIPLNQWLRGYCPICGGHPSLAVLVSDSSPRSLFCSRCHGVWGFNRVGCPFCRSTEAPTYYAGGEGRYRLYVCETCRRYLKTVDTRERGIPWSLPVECLVTVSMDLAALEKGFFS